MSSELATALTALVDRLAQLALHYQGLHEELNALALRLVSVTENRQSPGVNDEIEKQPTGVSPAVEEAFGDGEKATNTLPVLTLGSARPETTEGLAERVRHRTRMTTDEELGEIEARSRLKAEAMRWASTRRQLLLDEADFRDQIAPGDRDLLEPSQRASRCYLWMCKPSFRAPEGLTLLEDAARCFDLVADALGIVQRVLGDFEGREGVLGTFDGVLGSIPVCTASSGRKSLRPSRRRSSQRLRLAQVHGGSQADVRERICGWMILRTHRISMRSERSWTARKIVSLAGKRRMNGRGRASQGSLPRQADREAWRKRDRLEVDHPSSRRVLRQGIPPSNVEIRGSLLPIIDQSPDGSDLPQGYSLVLREIRRFLESEEEAGDQLQTSTDRDELDRAAILLSGTTVILLGGEPRSYTLDTLKSALRLKDLIWIGVDEIQSVAELEHYVARPEVAVVLLAIRWSRRFLAM